MNAKNRSVYFVLLAIIIALSAFLMFKNLGDRALWDDEAQTAVLARQVVTHGIPAFAEGENNIPTDRPDLSDYNKDKVFVWNTWLPFYLTAASFVLFGESEWSARLPFVLFGLFSLMLYARICTRLFGRNKRLILISLLMLALSVPFLLHLRQSRYYAISIFGTLWMVWSYMSILDGKKKGVLHLAAGGVLCFYSFYVIPFFNLGGIFLHALLMDRRKDIILKVILSSCLIAIMALPAVLYMRLWSTRPDNPLSIPDVGRSIWVYLLWINVFVMPLALPVIFVFAYRVKWRFLLGGAYIVFLVGAALDHELLQWVMLGALFASVVIFYLIEGFIQPPSGEDARDEESTLLIKKFFSLCAILTVVYVAGLSVISRYPFPRYLTPVLPLMLLFCSVLIDGLISKKKVLGWAVLAIILFTNLAGALPLRAIESLISNRRESINYSVLPRELWWWSEFRSDLSGFLYEITHSINDPEKAIASYLKKNSKPGEGLKTSYGGISMMFYLPEMRIISGWKSRGEIPDYLIFRDPYPFPKNETYPGVRYAAENLNTADIVWSNSPDPLFHKYRIPESKTSLKVFRRVN